MTNPFRYFNSSPEVIRLAVMMHIRYPLSLRQVEDLPSERGIDICPETVRWRWHLDEVFVRINGETRYLWRAVDHESEVLEVLATRRRDRRAALKVSDPPPERPLIRRLASARRSSAGGQYRRAHSSPSLILAGATMN